MELSYEWILKTCRRGIIKTLEKVFVGMAEIGSKHETAHQVGLDYPNRKIFYLCIRLNKYNQCSRKSQPMKGRN